MANAFRTIPDLAGNALKVLRVNSGETALEFATGGGGGLTAQSEESQTTTPDTAETPATSTSNAFFAFFTLPTDYALYRITGIEWKNGTVNAGSAKCGIWLVDADPPVDTAIINLGIGAFVACAGTGTTQRVSRVRSDLIPGGTILGAWVQFTDTSHRFRSFLAGATNSRKVASFGTNTPLQDTTAWTANATQIYMKLYYRGYQ